MALFTFMDLLLYMVIFSLTASHVEGHSRPTSSPRMAGQSTSYRSFMPASNTPTCEFKILMTLRTCCTPSDLGYCVSVVLFCVILLTLMSDSGLWFSLPNTPLLELRLPSLSGSVSDSKLGVSGSRRPTTLCMRLATLLLHYD